MLYTEAYPETGLRKRPRSIFCLPSNTAGAPPARILWQKPVSGAFTACYDGNPDVYIIPAEGGEPKRLTFHTDYKEYD